MSNHHSQKSIQLHYSQVANARARQWQRQESRLSKFNAGRDIGQQEYQQWCLYLAMIAVAFLLGISSLAITGLRLIAW